MKRSPAVGSEVILDALVVGAGFGGLYMLHKLRSMGFKALVIEAGSDVGGAWYWNRYPGARCDVESLAYSYSFSPAIDAEWRWSEQYSAQPEIARYMRFVCDRLELRKDIRFSSRLVKARFDKSTHLWTFHTEKGDTYRARHFISAAGPISAPIMPNIPGRENFKGEFYHSARWPHTEPDFTGKRVGVIGNGSSGTQLIPLVAEQAKKLTVFVRTPNYYVPARNRRLTDEDYQRWLRIRDDIRAKMQTGDIIGSGDVFMDAELNNTRLRKAEEFTPEQRREIMEKRWEHGGAIVARVFADVMTNRKVNDEVSEFLRSKVATLVKNPKTAEILTPRGYAYGTKRITVGAHFMETFNRDNVEAIDIKATPIERFTGRGVVVDGKEIELDAVIAASGFDALTGALTAIDIRGEDGQTIKEAWSHGCATFLGIGVAGFPNLHMIGGPGSLSVLVNVVMANELQADWIAGLLDFMRAKNYARVDVRPEAQEQWTRHLNEVVKGTVLEHADSWYVGTNVPGKPRGILAYAGGIVNYMNACNKSARNGFEGLRFSAAAVEQEPVAAISKAH